VTGPRYRLRASSAYRNTREHFRYRSILKLQNMLTMDSDNSGGYRSAFVHGGTNCTRGWNFADIFFSDSVKIMRFYDFAGTSVS